MSNQTPIDLDAIEARVRKFTEVSRIHDLYVGLPCHNKRHGDEWKVATVQHGDDAVTLTLGDFRKLDVDIPALIAEVRRLQTEIERLKGNQDEG